MLSHFPLLMRSNVHTASRHGATNQDESCGTILREVGVWTVVIHDAFKQGSSTRQASPLMTDGREINFVRRGGIPNQLILLTIEPAGAAWSLELDLKAPPVRHGL